MILNQNYQFYKIVMNELVSNLNKLRYGLQVRIFNNLLFTHALIYLDTLYEHLLWITTDKSTFLIDLNFTQITCYSLELQLEIKYSSGYQPNILPKYLLFKQLNIQISILFDELQQVPNSSYSNEFSVQSGRKPQIFNTIQNYIKNKKAICDYSPGFSRCLKKIRLQLQQLGIQNFLLFSKNQVQIALNNIEEFSGVEKADFMGKETSFGGHQILKITKLIYCRAYLSFLRTLKGGDLIAKFKKSDSFLLDKIIWTGGKLVTCFEALMRMEDKSVSYIIPEYKVDENLPLHDYFCFSSHNTYLTGNQLTSDCKISRYIEDLRKGIKCVQLDVHNKGDKEPIITHAIKGKGLCKPITFRQTIQAIDDFLELYPNHYPVILSIQNHATRQNQDLMYSILRKEFPQSILVPHDTTKSYTLSQAKGKIIVKNSSNIQNLVQFSLNYEMPKIKNYPFIPNKTSFSPQPTKWNGQFTQRSQQPFKNTQKQHTFENLIDAEQNQNEDYKRLMEKIGKYKRLKAVFNQKIDQSSYLPVQKIVQITGLFKAVKGIDTQNPSPFQCCSLQNTKIIKTQKFKITSFTKQAWVRSYPEGTEIYSSNYDFMEILARGVQIIALNTQTNDDYAIMLNSYFRTVRNANLETIGYIEKPEYLRSTNDKNIISSSYPSKRNYEFTFNTHYQLEFTLYSLDKAKIEINRMSQRQIKVSFTIGYFNEGFLLIKIGRKWIECLPLRFLSYKNKGEVIHNTIIGRDYEFEDAGVRILTSFRWT